MFLLDTNVCIQYLRGKNLLVRQRLAARQPQEVYLCAVVLMELHAGVLRSAQPAKNRANADQFAVPFASLPFDVGDA